MIDGASDAGFDVTDLDGITPSKVCSLGEK